MKPHYLHRLADLAFIPDNENQLRAKFYLQELKLLGFKVEAYAKGLGLTSPVEQSNFTSVLVVSTYDELTMFYQGLKQGRLIYLGPEAGVVDMT